MKIKHVALQALSGIVETDLLPFYDEILDEYETNDEYILSNVIDRLIEMKKDARPVLEKAAVHSDGNIAKEARKLLKKLGPE